MLFSVLKCFNLRVDIHIRLVCLNLKIPSTFSCFNQDFICYFRVNAASNGMRATSDMASLKQHSHSSQSTEIFRPLNKNTKSRRSTPCKTPVNHRSFDSAQISKAHRTIKAHRLHSNTSSDNKENNNSVRYVEGKSITDASVQSSLNDGQQPLTVEDLRSNSVLNHDLIVQTNELRPTKIPRLDSTLDLNKARHCSCDSGMDTTDEASSGKSYIDTTCECMHTKKRHSHSRHPTHPDTPRPSPLSILPNYHQKILQTISINQSHSSSNSSGFNSLGSDSSLSHKIDVNCVDISAISSPEDKLCSADLDLSNSNITHIRDSHTYSSEYSLHSSHNDAICWSNIDNSDESINYSVLLRQCSGDDVTNFDNCPYSALVSCEEKFVKEMNAGMTSYSRPLRHWILTPEEHCTLFQNIEKLAAISEHNLQQLKTWENLFSESHDSVFSNTTLQEEHVQDVYEAKVNIYNEIYTTVKVNKCRFCYNMNNLEAYITVKLFWVRNL